MRLLPAALMKAQVVVVFDEGESLKWFERTLRCSELTIAGSLEPAEDYALP